MHQVKMSVGTRMINRVSAARQSLINRWRPRNILIALMLAVLLVPLSQNFAFAATAPTPTPTPGIPNHYDPTKNNTSVIHLPPAYDAKGWKAPATPQPIARNFSGLMPPTLLTLDPAKGAHFLSDDGRLEVSVPPGAVTTADTTAAGGTIHLRILQLLPASGGTGGGSGLVSLGTYLFQAVDSTGHTLPQSLHLAPTVTLHYSPREDAFVLNPVTALFNDETTIHAAETAAVLSPTLDKSPARTSFGPQASAPTTHDHAARTLAVTLPIAPGGGKGAHASGVPAPPSVGSPMPRKGSSASPKPSMSISAAGHSPQPSALMYPQDRGASPPR